jgi:hypothetical protein
MAKEHREIRRMEIEPAENGGHTITHHYKERPRHSSKMGVMPGYEEPEHHVFGPEEGHEMLAHIANHLSIPEGKEKDEPEREEEEKEAEE